MTLKEDGSMNQAHSEMPKYISHKTVWALEIKAIEPCNAISHRLTFADEGYAQLDLTDDHFQRYMPVPGDFYVVYADGYKSISPRKAFLDGYTRKP